MWDWKLPQTGTLGLLIATILVTLLLNNVIGEPLKRLMGGAVDLFLKPFRWFKSSIYRKFAPRIPFTWYIRNYKKHVSRSGLTRIENPVGPNLDVPLENAFAPLRLISSSTEDSIDLFAHTATSHRCIILGGPGTGKTTLMKSLVTNIISQRAHPDLNKLVPVFVVLRKLASKQLSVKQAIIDAFEDHHCPGSETFVESALSQGKMMIILDGLDEVAASRQYVAEQIIDFCEEDNQQDTRNRVIVTCREHSYRTRDLQSVLPEVVRVEPFANHHMRIFLQGWPVHKGRIAIKLYGLIQNDPQIRDICRNPLLLTILTGLYLDSDNFQLPTSRDRFYKAAIDELLVQRPGRRNVKQTFQDEDKRQVLERVCLNRLENAQLHEDPEELHRDAILEHAEKILPKDSDLRGFITELVEVNGIIKPTADGIYTCSHRTIQEYFAAREARRTRTHIEVVNTFGNRQDLIEVLFFYCGLINNIPQLSEIAKSFVYQKKWIEAGKCVLHMTEVIEVSLIEKISDELFGQIQPNADFKIALEILSSLAQHSAKEFESARRLFSRAVDLLAEGKSADNASALEATLATSPDAAMKVIPGLLSHESKRWQIAGIKLLRDIGTDESLDQLVQILGHESSVVRNEAGRVLADMIKSRGQDLKLRAALLPDCEYSTIWPYKQYFPGNLALRIASAVADSECTTNLAINFAARAIRANKDNKQSDEGEFLRRWNKLPMVLNCLNLGKRAVRYLSATIFTIPVIFTLLCCSSSVWAWMYNKAIIIDPGSLQFYLLDRSRLMEVSVQTQSIIHHIESKYPPNASGAWRILPWNWSVEPVIPKDTEEAFKSLKATLTQMDNLYLLSEQPEAFNSLLSLTHKELSELLQAKINSLKQQLPHLHGKYYFLIGYNRLEIFSGPMMLLMIPLMSYLGRSDSRSRERRKDRPLTSSGILSRSMRSYNRMMMAVMSTMVTVMFILKGPNFILLYLVVCFVPLVLGSSVSVLRRVYTHDIKWSSFLKRFLSKRIQKIIWIDDPLISAIDDLRVVVKSAID